MAGETLVQKYEKRMEAMTLERQSFITHYSELSEFINPVRGRFQTSDRNKGTKRYGSIINSKATQALRIARSGMLAGAVSPARPWFTLAPQDPELMESFAVRVWLYDVERLIYTILSESNFYTMMSVMLGELLTFATGCMSMVEDFQDVVRFYTHTAGTYLIAQNDRYEIDTLAREFEWTTLQLVSKFGKERVSDPVRTAYDNGNYHLWWPVRHIIEPNQDYDPRNEGKEYKRFTSCYWEPGSRERELSRGGYDRFPAVIPRWDVTNEDIYGTDCPAMTALGDVKQLQSEEKQKLKGIEKMVNPPLKGPPSIKNVPISSLPGGVNIYEQQQGLEGLTTLYQVQPRLQEMLLDIQEVQRRIDTAFFVDLFMAISQQEGIQPKNQLDIMHRNEERLLQLGPVLNRLEGECLNKIINNAFELAIGAIPRPRADGRQWAGLVPPPPPELQGRPLVIKYVSGLSQAQRAVATGGIERVAGFVGGLVAMYPEAADKVDADQMIDEYAGLVGVPPKIVRSDEAVAGIRGQRAQAQAQAEQVAGLDAMAGAAQKGSAAVVNLSKAQEANG